MYEIEFELNLDEDNLEEFQAIVLELEELFEEESIDPNIYTDKLPDLDPIVHTSPIHFNIHSLCNKLNITKNLTPCAKEYISNIVYTKILEILNQSAAVSDNSKIITIKNILNALQFNSTNTRFIYPY